MKQIEKISGVYESLRSVNNENHFEYLYFDHSGGVKKFISNRLKHFDFILEITEDLPFSYKVSKLRKGNISLSTYDNSESIVYFGTIKNERIAICKRNQNLTSNYQHIYKLVY